MFIDFLIERFATNRDGEAVVWNGETYSYGWLLERTVGWQAELDANGVHSGAVTSLEADLSPTSVALFLALIERGCILVLPGAASDARSRERAATAQLEVSIRVDTDESVAIRKRPQQADHPLYHQLRATRHPGMVIFSSGSTGPSKAAVHDLVPFLEKFKRIRPALRTAAFLLFDHMGGVNTLLHALSSLSCLVTLPGRKPDAILDTVERHHVELLPVSPTFLNLMLVSRAYTRHNLASLRTISYGAEPIQESTLRRLHALFPRVELKQLYGLSEVGILQSRSLTSDSPFLTFGGEGCETRVVDGILHIKARSAMLGYLNAPSPFTADGWLDTGDAVQRDGEYLRIIGRTSDIINVGGEKVSPTDVESVIQERNDVADVVVYGERNPLTGNIVCARVRPADGLSEEARARLAADIKRHCRGRLRAHEVPVKVTLVAGAEQGELMKRFRR